MSFSDIKIESAGGLFLPKIESGKPQVIRLLQDNPKVRIQHGFGRTSTDCLGDQCLKCLEKDEKGNPSKDAKKKQRFKLNVYSHDQNKVMLFEFGAGILNEIQKVEESLKSQEINILETDLVLNAKGDGMEKKYSVQPMLKSRFVPPDLQLHKLDNDPEIPF